MVKHLTVRKTAARTAANRTGMDLPEFSVRLFSFRFGLARFGSNLFVSVRSRVGRARSEPGGTRWRTGGEVKGKLANGVGSQYSHAITERGVTSITQADAYNSAASSRLNWRPHRFKWTRPFRGKTKFGFCACAITFRTSYNATNAIAFLIRRLVTSEFLLQADRIL